MVLNWPLLRQQRRAQATIGQFAQKQRKNLQQLVRPIVLVLAVMHQHDVARLHTIESLLDAVRHAERPPVDRTDIPEHDLLTTASRLVIHAGSLASMRRAIEL